MSERQPSNRRRRARTALAAMFATALLGLPAVLAAGLGTNAAAAEGVTPIPDAGPTVLPLFVGHAAKAHPVRTRRIAQNPLMAPNPFNNIHNNSWMSDSYSIAGPLGRSPTSLSSTLSPVNSGTPPVFLCPSLTFDAAGRIITICSGRGRVMVVLVDAASLQPLSSFELPSRPAGEGVTASSLGVGYFYLDDRHRIVTSTTTNHIWVIAETGPRSATSFERVADYDLSATVGSDKINAVLPDWSGRIWFTTAQSGTVGLLDRKTGRVRAIRLDAGIANSFAVARGAAYIATDRSLYRLRPGARGVPRVVWSARYANAGKTKPGQYTAGTGTTPTILARGRFVAIADNAAQMHVVVYRTAARLAGHRRRTLCRVPVFARGRGATENSLIGSGRSIVVENNYGYLLDFANFRTTTSVPGVARVDIDADGRSCHRVWTNVEVAAPSLVPKLSTKTGLVYLYTKRTDPQSGADVWYWTAVDFRSGKTVWQRLSGTGPFYNNHYAGLAIGPTGTAYLSGGAGLMALRDSGP